MSDEPKNENEPAAEAGAPRRSRRSLLQLLGAVAVGVAGGAAASGDAGASNDANLVVGESNSATNTTALVNTGAITNNGAFVVNATASDWALEGSSGQIGVLGSGFIGVSGAGDIGGFFSGNLAALSLQPQLTSGAPTAGGPFAKGDILVDASGVMYLCVAPGNPGTWIMVSHGGYRPLSVPVRAYDSRTAPSGKLQPGNGDTASPRTIQITGVVAAVPANAVAVAGNMAVTQGSNGFATIWPSGSWPGTANINFGTGDLSNAFSVGLGAGGTVNVAASAATHVVIDIAGYIL